MTIIDGSNLLWALHEQSEEREITTETQLCRALDRYFRLTGEDGQVVFDGTGPTGRGEFESMSNLEVFFSGFSTDSDTVIEEKIKASTAPRRLTVVSSDRRLRKAAGERKAVAIKSEEFWEQVQKELRRKKPQSREPDAKREGLTQGETEQWMDLFDIED